jgi:cobalt-zinc-cadmium resistance protein CzcA
MVVVSAIRDLQSTGLPKLQAITEAALERLRTRMMTAMVAVFGFLPMATSTGVGAEVQRPLASVVIGGVISSTLVTLFVLPALYLLVPPAPVKPKSEDEHGHSASHNDH